MKALSAEWPLLTNDGANVAKAHDISCSLCGQMWWIRENLGAHFCGLFSLGLDVAFVPGSWFT